MIRIFKSSPFFRNITGYFLSALLFFIITLCMAYANGNIVRQPINKQQLVPSVLLEWQGEPDYVVLVDKSQQKVMVYRSNNLISPEKVCPCSTGENDGPKNKKNDRKTPEGIYFFTDSYVDESLAPIYGARALPINYPNLIDEMEGRSGYGIWFHGTNKPLEPNDTNGCIAMDNKDIEDLATFIRLFDTPVVISSRIEMVTPGEVHKEKQALTEIIENWMNTWQNKEIERYMSFYHQRFTSGGRNWLQWKEYKSRLANRYSYINVEVNNLRLLATNGVVLAIFDQTYSTPSLYSEGTKMLYLTKNSDQWKIIGETFESDKVQVAYTLNTVENFIFSWKDAWEKEELEKYILCYDENFQSRGMDLIAWENHRKRLNEKYRSLKIDIRDLKINRISEDSASVSFTQYYSADSYQDIGNKELVIIKKDNDWKIKEEEWTPIKEKTSL